VDRKELETRTKRFALKIIDFVNAFPQGRLYDVIGYQLLKCGTSVGANHREANRAQSYDDFIHKTGLVEKEASESQYWLEICAEKKLGPQENLTWLLSENSELLAIFSATGRTARRNRIARKNHLKCSKLK
jgi:four helix bundle protein